MSAQSNGQPKQHLVEPGTRLRLSGRGRLCHPYLDSNIYVEVDGEAIWDVPEDVRVIGVLPLPPDREIDLTIDVLPPERVKAQVEVEPNRTYTVSLANGGDVTIRTLKHRTLARLGDDDRTWCVFTTPPDIVCIEVEKSGQVLIAETPLTAEDFQPEITALNEKLMRKGFWLGPRIIQRVDDGRGTIVQAIDDVGLAPRGQQMQVVASKDVIKHGPKD